MGTLDTFHSEECPRCGHSNSFFRLGDAHHLVMRLVRSEGDNAEAAPDLECYVKVCRNCAFTELYSKYLVDQFESARQPVPEFGEISRAPGGQRLVSVFVEYEHKGQRATDFTVPIPDDTWFALKVGLDDLSDDALIDLAFPGAYKKAWLDRVGPFPRNFASNLRRLIRTSE
jgi:predicted nucleic-acid-binding Zn-ribbon protein